MLRRRRPVTGGHPGMPPALAGRRRHGAAQHGDRYELEMVGWRTTLEYRENHVRGRDGRLRQLHVEWRAEAERAAPGGGDAPIVIWASGSTIDKVWSRLRLQADLVESRHVRRDAVDGADTSLVRSPAGRFATA